MTSFDKVIILKALELGEKVSSWSHHKQQMKDAISILESQNSERSECFWRQSGFHYFPDCLSAEDRDSLSTKFFSSSFKFCPFCGNRMVPK